MIPNASPDTAASKRRLGLVLGIIAVSAGVIGVAAHKGSSPPAVTTPPAPAAIASKHHPSLYCDFYDFMRKSVVASFEFSVSIAAGREPTFSELYVVEHDNVRTDFGSPDRPSPIWTYAIDDGTPTIASPDGETRIVLYGLKPATPGVFWGEAGVRSNAYRNLEGKCRQAYFAP